MPGAERVRIVYLAPWVDFGGSDKGTIDWFRFLDRDRFRAALITTQPSANRRLAEVVPHADEIWDLPDLMAGDEFVRFILGFVHSRQIRIVHIMNSRLGFELLPYLVQLPARPRIVVQLHVEEPDRAGYVRYVTSRYGNLVDAFSVSSQTLYDALDSYDVPLVKRRLIRTGVDAEREFSVDRVRPIGGLESDVCQILYPARLTPQKDPLLMVEVAARLKARGVRFRIHVLADGELAPDVRRRIDDGGLEAAVLLHGPCAEIGRWYAACDLVLLTSRWEGVPYVIYEAMAMARPVIAPALPGIRELLGSGAAGLVGPGMGPEAYADAVTGLARDPSLRAAIGARNRATARAEYSLERMAGEHGALYEDLLASQPDLAPPAQPEPVAGPYELPVAGLRGRRPSSRPLVSVIVPCYNHGRHLPSCLRSIAEQTYSPIETIVVDDGSDDLETLHALEEIGRDQAATLIRLPTNSGPAAARNAGVERAGGRYVLPLDADNLLYPDAVASLVEQLVGAGEQIGFVYPGYDFVGNETGSFEPPSYNLDALLAANYCDSSSLIDREVFDRGFRYPDDIGLGHEDWDFALTLAEHGILGEPSRMKTLQYRKHGFTRSDLVAAAKMTTAEAIADRHPRLFEPGRRVHLKGRWNPAISLIVLDALAPDREAVIRPVRAAAAQSCQDFELVVRCEAELGRTELGGRLRRIPSELGGSRAEWLSQALRVARGRYALVTYGSLTPLLADRAQIEKILRALAANDSIQALALAEADRPLAPFALLDAETAQSAKLRGLCWHATGPAAPPASLCLPADEPLEALAVVLSVIATVQWRHLPPSDRRRPAPAAEATADARTGTAIGAPAQARDRDVWIRASSTPFVPELPRDLSERLGVSQSWSPARARKLCRHLHHPTGRYVFTNELLPPPDCSVDHQLGWVRALPLEGTTSLRSCDDGERWAFRLGDAVEVDGPGVLGFIEQAPLAVLDRLGVARHRATGQLVLIAGADDPLAGQVHEPDWVGYIEPHPTYPRRAPHVEVRHGLLGLVRTVDREARRHRYGLGRVPAGDRAGELGALLTEPVGDCEPLWIDADGLAHTPRWPGVQGRPPLQLAVRWTAEPLGWRGLGPAGPRLRAAVRRAYDSARILAKRPPAPRSPPGRPTGYLLPSPLPRSLPLYAAIQAATGDQLLSTDPAEAEALGYGSPVLLGHLAARAPVTGTLGPVHTAIPWAWHFGVAAIRT